MRLLVVLLAAMLVISLFFNCVAVGLLTGGSSEELPEDEFPDLKETASWGSDGPKVVRIAAFLAIIFSFCPKFAALIYAMPTATVGGVSLVLYGMISAVGVRNLVENKVDFTNNRNVLVAALILVLAIGINFGPGSIKFGAEGKIALSGLAVAALVGIILNAVLPGKDFKISYDEYASGKRAGSDSSK